MALDLKAIRRTVIDSVRQSIGTQLTQQVNPTTQESYGIVLNARPNPSIAQPDFPYAVLDVTSISDTDWFLTNLVFDEDLDRWQYETHKTLEMSITIYGDGALSLADQLATSYRRYDMLDVLSDGDVSLAEVNTVTILPELMQTDWLDVGVVTLSVRANDIYVDPDMESIEAVYIEGTLNDAATGDLTLEAHYDDRPFIFTVDTAQTGISDSSSFTLPLSTESTYDISIDWGDGSIEEFSGYGVPTTHTYATSGTYEVSVTGQLNELIFNVVSTTSPISDGMKLLEVSQWGGSVWKDVEQMFNGCTSLETVSALDIPNLSEVTSFYRLFRTCLSLTSINNINDWDVSSVTNMNTTFSSTILFNQDLNNWDVSNVTDFFATFAGNNQQTPWSSFNGDITTWDMTGAVTTRYMFFRAAAFDKDISVWDMSSVETIENMFYQASIFNQPIGAWDLSNVYDRGNNQYSDSCLEFCDEFNQDLTNWPFGQWQTFHDALTDSPKFNQDVSQWDLSAMGSGADQGLENTFNGTAMSTENYDLALEAWANETYHSTPLNMKLGIANTQYSASQQSNRDILTNTFGWEITDAGSV